eukprot:TRINITY_DN1038_c0_g1_i1.p1 TRINITY_DN1038_c0_g1~~TRINITY_DN1038_c0_g1_i1.p1  ORF type:complete len:305 (+),score=54.41 TRINITY_DN1038_c0_g1_i1:57-917(+)
MVSVQNDASCAASRAACDLFPTTLMVKNITCRASSQEVLQVIAALGFKDTYDFFYLPQRYASKNCQTAPPHHGYAFINFKNASHSQAFSQALQEKAVTLRHSNKKLSSCSAHVQGVDSLKDALVRTLRKNPRAQPWTDEHVNPVPAPAKDTEDVGTPPTDKRVNIVPAPARDSEDVDTFQPMLIDLPTWMNPMTIDLPTGKNSVQDPVEKYADVEEKQPAGCSCDMMGPMFVEVDEAYYKRRNFFTTVHGPDYQAEPGTPIIRAHCFVGHIQQQGEADAPRTIDQQ